MTAAFEDLWSTNLSGNSAKVILQSNSAYDMKLWVINQKSNTFPPLATFTDP